MNDLVSGDNISYFFTETSNVELRNHEYSTYEVYINWYDDDDSYGYRPSIDSEGLVAGYNVYRHLSGQPISMSEATDIKVSLTENEYDDRVWGVSLIHAPMYQDGTGIPYVYYVKQNTDIVKPSNGEDEYREFLRNVDNYTSEEEGLFDGGTNVPNITLNADSWKGGWASEVAAGKLLPKFYDGGKPVLYWVAEVTTSEDFDHNPANDAIKEENKFSFKLTNHHEIEITNVQVTKVWTDDSDRDALRGEYGVTLFADGVAVVPAGSETGEVMLNADQLTYTWTNLPERKDGKLIVYAVQETSVPKGYTATVTVDANNAYLATITNTHTPPELPMTGDTTDVALPLTLLVVSGVAMGISGAIVRKKNKKGANANSGP